MKKFVCMHGHFYQPPRENPWTGEVDAEPSAAPFHDWNERIAKECYEANVHARLQTPKGEARVNNFELLSFDIGPTLLSWLKRRDPEIYKAILDADKKSAARHNGHGNAMAQVYNHIIMPLAKKRDKVTQVVWGIEDFKFHYRRKPEGMWLSETAVDRQTLRILVDHGITFTVLAPNQAARFRRLGIASPWQPAHGETIDSRQAYRLWLEGGKQFHVFFYNSAASHAIAFGGLLNNGDQLVHQLMHAFGRADHAQLVSTGTDGETFGHHHKFGEMAVAYALHKIRDQRMAEVTNFASFLERHPSRWEVDIKENSSWSCAHGVERWRADCGCRLSQRAGWDQKWRPVLREALEWLQSEVDRAFENGTAGLLKDPWQARDQYIHVLLDPSVASKARYLASVSKKSLRPEEQRRVWDLLEAERFSMFMFTSCAWFFDDIAGIEPVQILKFALRALELAQPHTPKALEPIFVRMLSAAKSNDPTKGTGADVFEKQVKPARSGAKGWELGANK